MFTYAHRLMVRFVGITVLLASAVAHAGNWGVAPIKLEFDRATRTGLITVNNEDTKPVNFQIKLYRWFQDAQGQDQYEESNDLVYFPQIMSIEPDQKKLIRVGIKRPAETVEQTYRLFIEELPPLTPDTPDTSAKAGASVAVLIRFGVPIFLIPTGALATPIFSNFSMGKDVLNFVVNNGGNRHVRYQEMTLASGVETLGKADGWYVLAGARREFAIPVKKMLCGSDQTLKISTTVDDKSVTHSLTTKEITCTP